MVTIGEQYRVLEQIGRDVNSDGTAGSPLLPDMVGTVKQLDDNLVVLDFSFDEPSQPRRSVSFDYDALATLFERVEE